MSYRRKKYSIIEIEMILKEVDKEIKKNSVVYNSVDEDLMQEIRYEICKSLSKKTKDL